MGWPATRAADLVGVRYPILQAGMAGGITPPALVAAVSEAGALGMLGAGTLSPDSIREAIREVRARTERPFGVNLLLPERREAAADAAAAVNAVLAPFRAEVGLDDEPAAKGLPPGLLEAQLDTVLDERVPVFSFAFGMPPEGTIAALRELGTVVLGTANTVEEARRIAEAGADGVVAQGAEAGGHRAGLASEALVGTVALVPAVVDAVDVPVVATGGIMDGRGIAAALALGADAVQLGTAFVLADESTAAEAYKQALAAAPEDASITTRVYTGRRARTLRTPMIDALEAAALEIPPYPLQASLTAGIRERAAQTGRADLLLPLGGQGTRLARRLSAAELVRALVAETEAALAGLR